MNESSSSYAITFRIATSQDIAAIAILHQRSLPLDVLPSLGKRALHAYYESCMAFDGHEVVLVVVDDRPVGFCQVAYRRLSVFFILRRYPWMFVSLAKLGLTKPKNLLVGLVEVMRSNFEETPAIPEVAFIGIDPEHQGKGIGPKLISHVNKIVAHTGHRQLFTKTSNPHAVRMYARHFGGDVFEEHRTFGSNYRLIRWYTEQRCHSTNSA